jgi:hypothetical protein
MVSLFYSVFSMFLEHRKSLVGISRLCIAVVLWWHKRRIAFATCMPLFDRFLGHIDVMFAVAQHLLMLQVLYTDGVWSALLKVVSQTWKEAIDQAKDYMRDETRRHLLSVALSIRRDLLRHQRRGRAATSFALRHLSAHPWTRVALRGHPLIDDEQYSLHERPPPTPCAYA